MCIFTKSWWVDTGIRALKTMAETALSLIGTNTIGITEVNWVGVGSACILSGVVTFLINIKNIPTDEDVISDEH